MQRKSLVAAVLVSAVAGVVLAGFAPAADASEDVPVNRGWESGKNRGWDHAERSASAPTLD